MLTKIVFALLWTLVFFLAVLLVLPFSYRGYANFKESRLIGGGKLEWAFGLLGVKIALHERRRYEILLLGWTVSSGEIESVQSGYKKSKGKKEKKKTSRKKPDIRELMKIGKVFLSKLLKVLGPDYIGIRGTYGFEDPAMTGLVSGFVAIAKNASKSADIAIYPEFTGEFVDMEAEFYGGFSLGRLAMLGLSTLLKKPVRSLLFAGRK